MAYSYFSRGGEILPSSEAVVALGNIEYAYGFGVYETVRVSKSGALFLDEHCERLMESAKIIGLPHAFTPGFAAKSAGELVSKNEAENCNLKILLVGGKTSETASLYILCLNPMFPDRKLYKQGARTITKELERPFPHAKTLNMLPSYLAHRDAKAAGAYDALLVNRHGCITEGSSTNFFALKGRTIYSPPESDILLGVTRDKVLKVAKKNGFKVVEKDLKLDGIEHYDNLFLTGTSAKLMPIRSVDDDNWEQITPALKDLMRAFDQFMDEAGAQT